MYHHINITHYLSRRCHVNNPRYCVCVTSMGKSGPSGKNKRSCNSTNEQSPKAAQEKKNPTNVIICVTSAGPGPFKYPHPHIHASRESGCSEHVQHVDGAIVFRAFLPFFVGSLVRSFFLSSHLLRFSRSVLCYCYCCC